MNSYINGIHQIECKTPNIGNLLSMYFDSVCISFEDKNDFKANMNLDTGLFVDKLPNFIKYKPEYFISKQNRFTYSAWNWEYDLFQNVHYLQPLFSRIIRNLITDELWNKAEINEPIVIHFRASDGPMNRHDNYTMVHYSWYQKVLDIICQGKYPDICIIYNNYWHKQDAEVCNFLFNHFKDFLQKRGHKVKVISGSVDLDFVRMMRAKYLIPGCIMSSMSYMAGMLSNNISILESTIYSNNNFPKRFNFNIINSLNYRIPHKLIPNYYDFNSINNLLKIKNVKNIIAFQFSNDFEYMALENANLANNLFPGWICYFYVTINKYKQTTAFKELSNMKNVKIIFTESKYDWRFSAINQNFYNSIIIRNVKSLLDENDAINFSKWMISLCDFNITLSNIYNIDFKFDSYYEDHIRNNNTVEYFLHHQLFDNITETEYCNIGCRNKILNNLIADNSDNISNLDFNTFFYQYIIQFVCDKRSIYIS